LLLHYAGRPAESWPFVAKVISSKGRENVVLRPFAELDYSHYNVYWTLTPE
jgi:hypothetical protein